LLNINGQQQLLIWQKSKCWLYDTELVPKTINEVALYIKKQPVGLFEYPQACFYKNELLSFAVASSGEMPHYCRLPDLTIRDFMAKWPGVNISLMSAPFERLSKDFSKKN